MRPTSRYRVLRARITSPGRSRCAEVSSAARSRHESHRQDQDSNATKVRLLILRPPLDPELLDDPLRLLLADLYDLEGHVTSLSCGNERGVAPRLVPLEGFVADATVVEYPTAGKTGRIAERIARKHHGVVLHFIRHFPPVTGTPVYPVRRLAWES